MEQPSPNHTNPYAAPTADLSSVNRPASNDPLDNLASRGTRLGAALLDALIQGVIVLPIVYFAGFFEEMKTGQVSFSTTMILLLLGIAGYTLLNGYLLQKNGQTIGKKIVRIKIVNAQNEKPELLRILGLRFLPIQLLSQIPVVGSFLPLVDVLLIFREDCRCAHDLIAGTYVVNV